MLHGRNKKILMIIGLCFMLIFMGVGFALLSTTIRLDGDANLTGIWDIQITDMKVLNKKGMAESVSFSYDGVKANFLNKLYAPGDSIEYQLTVTNKGNIKAALKQITSNINPKYEYVILDNSLAQGEVLDAGESITFTIKSEFDIKATTLPNEPIEPVYEIEIIYYQHEGNQLVTPPDHSTENVCFTIHNDGTLGDYDFSCGTDVVVPTSINGINVTKISAQSFESSEFMKEKGYVKVKEYSFFNPYFSGLQTYYVLESEEGIRKALGALGYNGIYDPYYPMLSQGYYYSFNTTSEDNIYVYNSWYTSGFDFDGNEVYEEPYGIMHWFMDDVTGEEYMVIEDESVYNSAVLYLESWGYDESFIESSLYVAGDPDIPYYYRTKLSDYILENDVEIKTWYTDGANNNKVSNASSYVTSLDLSNAVYLESIQNVKFYSINSVKFPEGSLKTIGFATFRDAVLDEVIIPSTVTTIDTYAFMSMPKGSVIKINRRNSSGMTLGLNWSGNATVKYIG